ncbi:MAG: ATP-binding protein [Deltaproteobacteria bacterium]|nr:ATP-binding protein [Deltaproteobacteria bacterium]
MERAIEVMRQSVHEPRKDDKASPKVGTVLRKADGTIESACRGELRYGDHAEFTLLERKNRDNKLDGSVLFATLEPCAPDSRHPPKLSCAERIVLARIKQVWVGIEDPDPKVDRKGIQYLMDNGVTVHMFDRDLQELIHEVNKDFLAQALERAAAAEEEKKAQKIVLSSFERTLPTTAIEDFSNEALEKYRRRAGIADAIDSPAFQRRLVQQGSLREETGRLVPTGFGFLLFGKEPRRAIRQGGLLGAIHFPNGQEERREFDEPLVLIPGLVEEWLRNKLPNIIDRGQMRRKEQPALPFEMVREGVVNALIHRNYDLAGAKSQLAVTVNTITIKSPGQPPPPVTLEQLQTFNAPMLSRNPELHYVFARMEMAEEQGLGIKSLKAGAEKLGLPLPTYSFEAPYLVLTLYRSREGATLTLSPKILGSLNKDEKSGWEFLVSKQSATMAEYADHMEFDKRKAQRHLSRFINLGLLRRVGVGRATKYEVARP